MRFSRYLMVAALMLAALFLGTSGGVDDGALAQAQAECTVAVQPGESLQAAIDAAEEGAVIYLPAGTWEENIVIEKSLTLRGAGAEETVIVGVKEGYPVVWIMGPEEAQTVSVKVEGLSITGAEGECADLDKGICAHGVLIQGAAQVAITGSTISGNWRNGIELRGSAQAVITGSTISANGANGIHLLEKAILRLVDSRILRNQQYGVSAHLPDCAEDYRSRDEFTGEVAGSGNLIPGPDDPDGNRGGAVCPPELAFLMTEEGREYP